MCKNFTEFYICDTVQKQIGRVSSPTYLINPVARTDDLMIIVLILTALPDFVNNFGGANAKISIS